MVRVTVGSVMALVAFACAGRSVSGDGSSGDDTGGSAGETGGSGGTMTVGGTVGMGAAPATGGRATGGRGDTAGTAGTAGVVDPSCTLPPDPGPCEELVPAFAFDIETGLCLPFFYGGCEGNANFETAEACYRACDRAGVGGTAYCDSSDECFPISTRCCACSGFAFVNVVGVNVRHMPIIETTKCAAVDCDECVTAGLEWFGADCHDNHCVAWDARAGDLSLCHSAGECRLRNGLDCCERCSSMNDTVAINASVESEWICREPCPPCPNGGPTYPRNLFAGCYDNHCLLFTRDL